MRILGFLNSWIVASPQSCLDPVNPVILSLFILLSCV